MNSPIEKIKSISDKLMLLLAFLLLIAGVVMFYAISKYGAIAQASALILGVGGAICVALFSNTGKTFINFARASYREVRKVVWPTRKEAGQMTLVVFGFVLIMAIYLWVSDKTIEWIIFSLILGWR